MRRGNNGDWGKDRRGGRFGAGGGQSNDNKRRWSGGGHREDRSPSRDGGGENESRYDGEEVGDLSNSGAGDDGREGERERVNEVSGGDSLFEDVNNTTPLHDEPPESQQQHQDSNEDQQHAHDGSGEHNSGGGGSASGESPKGPGDNEADQ